MVMNRYISLLLLVFATTLSAQETLSLDSVAARLWRQTTLFPNEKIHLHTDRSVYSERDTIWLRGYLVNAINNQPEATSRYMYAELVNPFGEVVKRVKIRQDDNTHFYGYLPLGDLLPGGEYTLRAYTRYMENAGETFFFRKPIHIVSPFSYSIETKVMFEGNPEQGQIKGIVEMKNQLTGEPIALENVKVYDEKELVENWSENKQYRFKVSPYKYKQKVVKMVAANYEQFLPILLPANDYHVDFLPEGGNLPTGVLSRMAFKALNTFGLSEEVSGVVKDETGNEVCKFETRHAGMGSFYWIPEAGKKYRAECVSKAGVTRSFDLPVARKDACSLGIVENRGMLVVSLLADPSVAEPSTPFTLLVHQRGVPLLTQPMLPSTPLRIEKKVFSSGVLHFVLVSPAGKIVSERLAFVKNED